MTDDNTIWKQTLAGVISGLVLLALGWLFGVLPLVWSWLLSAVRRTLGPLTYNVSIPVWALLAGGAAIIGLFKWAHRQGALRSSQPSPATQHFQLGTLDHGVIRALARADGQWIQLNELAQELKTSRLLLERSLEKLYRLGFLMDTHNYVSGTSFRLSPKGRDFAIHGGFVSNGQVA